MKKSNSDWGKFPPPEAALNFGDIEALAEKTISPTAWAYYRSAGEDEYTMRENAAAYKRFWFRPRVLNRVSKVSTETSILSLPSSLPIFVAPAALARLGHPDGEMNLVRAAGLAGIVQGISTNASCSLDEIISAKTADQNLIFQLTVNVDRAATMALIKRVERYGFKSIMLAVDSAVAGKRELDLRGKGDVAAAAPLDTERPRPGSMGVAHGGKIQTSYASQLFSYIVTSKILIVIQSSGDDIHWIRSLTQLPLVLKGIQCVEDAEKAHQYGVDGIVLSTHSGRQLDFSQAPITVLHELSAQRPDLMRNPSFEVYIDSGVTRGTDVLKALCLGARAVGLGRAFLYANGIWGQQGCERVIQKVMREEIETGMRLLGVTSIEELNPTLLRSTDRDPELRLSSRL